MHRADLNDDGDHVDSGEGTWFHLTDDQLSTVALIGLDAVVAERVSYDSYGQARHHRGGDVNGDGASDGSDLAIVFGLWGKAIGDPEYRAEADLNHDGEINGGDYTLLLGTWGAALPAGLISNAAAGGPDNAIGWDGYVFNPATGDYLVRHRTYMPTLGRWGERDPMGYAHARSLYEYVDSAPVDISDPSGLMPPEKFSPGSFGQFSPEPPKSTRPTPCAGSTAVMTYTLAEADDRTGMPTRTREAKKMKDLIADIREQLQTSNRCCVERLQIDGHSGVEGVALIAQDVTVDTLFLGILGAEFDERNSTHVTARNHDALMKELCGLICQDDGSLELVQCNVGEDNPTIDYLKKTCGEKVTIVTWSGSVRWWAGGTWSFPWDGKWKKKE